MQSVPIPSLRRRRRASRLALALGLALLPAARVLATDITACGQTVAPLDIGVLTTDLSCSGMFAVLLNDRATLEMAGHTVSGSSIFCDRTCTIHGPGDVTGLSGVGAAIVTNSGGRLIIEDVNVHDNDVGIVSGAARNIFTNVVASNNTQNGIQVFGRVRGTNITANNNGHTGFRSENRSVVIDGLTANGNGWIGLINNGGRTVLRNSILTGNAFPFDPPLLDLYSVRRPRLFNTTCDHSLGPVGQPWGVCSGD